MYLFVTVFTKILKTSAASTTDGCLNFFMKNQERCRCGLSKSDGFVSVGSSLALYGLFDCRAGPEFCVCEPWGSLSSAFSFPTLTGVGQPLIHELNIQVIRLWVSRQSHSTVCRHEPTRLYQYTYAFNVVTRARSQVMY